MAEKKEKKQELLDKLSNLNKRVPPLAQTAEAH